MVITLSTIRYFAPPPSMYRVSREPPEYPRETDRRALSLALVLALLCIRGVVRARRSSLARIPRYLFSQSLLSFFFLLSSFLFSFSFFSPFFPTFFHSRYSSKRAKHSNRYHGRSSWNERLWKARHRTEEIASARFLSVLLSARRCTLPGGKTPTRSRAHPSSTLARLYTQGVHTTTVIPSTPYGAFPLLQSHPPASFTPSPESAPLRPPSTQSLHPFYPVTAGTPPATPLQTQLLCALSQPARTDYSA